MKLINFGLLRNIASIAKNKVPTVNLNCHLTTTIRTFRPIGEKMNIIPVEALSDNYMYLLVDEESGECATVDPVEPKKILSEVARLNLKLTQVLITHHHW